MLERIPGLRFVDSKRWLLMEPVIHPTQDRMLAYVRLTLAAQG